MAQETAQPELPQQAGKLLTQVAGYLGTQAMAIGLRFGLFEELAKHPDGLTSDALAKAKGTNSLYTQVWCRSAYAAEVLDVDEGGAFRLAPHMETLLLEEDHPAYAGALPQIFSQPELGELFEENFTSGKRIWWDDVSPAFIQAVSGTARPFYTRLIAGGLAKGPGLSERLADGGRVMDLACGAGIGLVKLARALPNVSLVGVDGDAHSLGLVKERLAGEGLEDRVTLVQSTLEELDHSDEYDAVIINVSMHECRDIDKVTQNVHRALKQDGYFVISDFPFPESIEGCRTVPARIMSGIQYFEAMIDDQLMPTKAFVELLNKHGFRNVDAFDMTPVHAVTHGQK